MQRMAGLGVSGDIETLAGDLTMHIASRLGAALAITLSLSACGYSQSDRLLSGAGLGAVGGTVIGAAAGNPGAGAAIGAVAGGAVGGLTSSRDVNLGRPLWR